MSVRQVVIIGAGQRVRETALPAIAVASDFEVRSLVARSDRTLEHAGEQLPVRALDGLQQSDLDGIDLVYMVVSKDAVPNVLTKLARFDVRGIDLLIETPVVRFRHFRHAKLARAFRNAWVSEDCAELAWFDTVHAALDEGLIGELRAVLFQQSAYAYHGVAMAKTLLGRERVARAKRRALGDGRQQRELRFAGGLQAAMIEPRDYDVGHVTVVGSKGTIADFVQTAADSHRLEPVIEGGALRGFRIGDVETWLDDEELALAGDCSSSTRVCAHMDALKRVGYLRLLRRIADGRGAYPLVAGLDDMVVDYWLEKLGRWIDTPLTSVRSPLARFGLAALSRLGG